MARTTDRKVSKGRSVEQGGKPETVTLKVTVPREVARVLRLEAFGRDVSLGRVFEEMVRATPRRFTLVDRGVRGSGGSDGPGISTTPASSEAHGGVRPLGLVSEAG